MTPSPQLFQTPLAMQKAIRQAQVEGKRIGLVPTMGALHEGHLSLVAASQAANDLTIVTIFVNPTQFGPGEDFDRYPRTLDEDLAKLSVFEPVWVFVPETEAMYPAGSSTIVKAPNVAALWEGTHRPGHFDGVATVVLKLFQAAPANRAYFGAKDFQQVRVIEEMTRDLLLPIEIQRCPIVREVDGLAMSSRNRYLSAEQREVALSISRSLSAARQQIADGEQNAERIQDLVTRQMTEAGVDSIDYVAVVDPVSLESVQTISSPVAILVAVHVGSTRLIDNCVIDSTGNV